MQSKAKVGDAPALASEERCLGPFSFATSARAERWSSAWSSGTETAFSPVSLGSCQSLGGGSRGPPGPQPGVPVLPAPHLRLLPDLVLASGAASSLLLPAFFSFSPPDCFFLQSFSSPFLFCLPLFLSVAFSFLLFLSDSLIYSGSVSVFLSPPHPFSFSRLFTYEGLFLLRVALFSETHKSKSDHCPMPSPPFLYT